MNAKIVGLGSLCIACTVGTPIVQGENIPAHDDGQVVSSYPYDNEQGVIPWKILLSHANHEIPGTFNDKETIHWGLLPVQQKDVSRGTCYPSGRSGTADRYAIKDLLAQHLAYLDQGTNRIIGRCFGDAEKECFIKISHHNKEDVFGFEIRFKTIRDNIIMDALFCDITP
jgi:hypothetical protein